MRQRAPFQSSIVPNGIKLPYYISTNTSQKKREPVQQANLGRDIPVTGVAHPRNRAFGVVGRTAYISARSGKS